MHLLRLNKVEECAILQFLYLIYICFSNYWEFTVHLTCVKILPYARAIEKNLLKCSSSSLIVEGVRIVHCDRLFAWIKCCCSIKRCSPLEACLNQGAEL